MRSVIYETEGKIYRYVVKNEKGDQIQLISVKIHSGMGMGRDKFICCEGIVQKKMEIIYYDK